MIWLLVGCHPVDLGHEYTEPIDILDADGLVVARGWARGPLFGFDRDAVLDPTRVREWDWYGIDAAAFAVEVSLAEIVLGDSHLVLASVAVHDHETGAAAGPSWLLVDADDVVRFDPAPDADYHVAFGSGTLDYGHDGDARVVTFTDGDDHGTLRIGPAPGDTMALVTPYETPGQFFYEDKAVAMPASGEITVGGTTYTVPSDALAVLDFVRSAPPRAMTWDWATAGGTVDGHVVGLNLGSVYGDETGGTPNALIVDGVLHKLGRVDWTWDDPAATWRFAGDGVALALEPIDHREEPVALGDYHLDLWKGYGRFGGTVEVDGETWSLDGLVGAAEHADLSW